MRDLLGVTSVTAPEGTGVPSSVLYADFDGAMNSDAWRIYQDVGAAIADQVMASTTLKTNFITCDPSTSGCLQTTIQTFGRKAFRRPLTTAEVSNFMALGTGTPTYTPTQVANTILYAFLVDPSFLYIEETNTTAAPSPAPSGALLLSSDEVAARLSYMIWGSTPDATLSTAADNNQLQTQAQILAQAQRMVAVSSKTAPQLSAVHEKWVQMNNSGQHWWKIDHDPTVFPLYQAGDVATYQAEMDNFFATVAQTGTYSDLFLSNVGFVTSDTAQIYGLSNASSYGTTLTKVQLDSNQRPGFMSRIGFLQSYSHYTNTAPILRGAFIAIYMLGINVPPPPAGAAMTPIPPGTYATNRDATVALVTQSGTTCVGLPRQRHRSLRLRAGELQRDRSVADGRPAGGNNRRDLHHQFRRRHDRERDHAPAAHAGDRRFSGRTGDLRPVLGLLRLRPGSQSAGSVCRGSDRHQHRRRVVPHHQHPLRPNPNELV